MRWSNETDEDIPENISLHVRADAFIVGIAHLLLYIFTKPEWLVISVSPHDELSFNTSLNVAVYVTQTVLRALPISFSMLRDYFHSLLLCIFTKDHSAHKTDRGGDGTDGAYGKGCCLQDSRQ